ncbi:MYXO-CTERM sorting domain-containing protein [Polyangium mundeleinium]|uniref:MYXO-CTERM sorting domain-containing protein n=1 Tax=Polyangium mundeleinium TaxID=2995306 RepID=A0ABT5EJN8_9BACT|nr:MYXO-CTERM sorting domain-containing protein [Polyangium mundeleinium]MDC0741684.1 MYXO-CTERM sorting domain-containing protein [Polyangium mundeleinium]
MIFALTSTSRRSSPAARRRATLRHGRSPLAREKARLVAHFRAVLAELRAHDTSHLSPDQRAARAGLIAELQRYARTGRFPRNLDFPGIRMPYFVDAFGTRCAMAHLIEATGETDLVARVAKAANNAFVREIEGDAALRAWLDRAGLTAAEAARIQPSYCFVSKADACFCQNNGVDVVAVAEATVTAIQAGGMATAKVDVLHGAVLTSPMVGDTIDVYNAGSTVGAPVLVGITENNSSVGAVQLDATGSVKLSCGLDVPKISKQDAINAMLATTSGGENSACSDYLEKKDAVWGESQCGSEESGDEVDGGCSVTAAGGASPLLLGSLVLAAATFARRRRVARKRKASAIR